MKIALINPKGTIFSNDKSMTFFLEQTVSMDSFRHFWSAPCLGLLTVAAYLPDDCEIEYIDEIYKEIDFQVSYDFVCISAMTVQAERAYEIATQFRKQGVLTVLGGIHATILPKEALNYVDTVLAGEGEILFPQFLDDYKNKKPKNLYQSTPEDVFDMSACITPRYDLIAPYDYPIVNIYTTRGCPRKCNFCCASNVYGLRYRRKTNAQIMKEIDSIVLQYPDKLILFADDNLFVCRKESKELLTKLKEKRIRWIAQTDISIADDDNLLQLMYDSGCQWIVIGFESISEKSLKSIEKNNFKQKYVSRYKTDIAFIQSFGINVYGTFIVGLDEDDSTVFDNTAEFIMETQLYGANITVPTPLPGTELRRQMESEGRIISNKWSDYTLWDVVIKPKGMSAKELKSGLLYIYNKISKFNNTNKRLIQMLEKLRKRQRGV